MTRSLGVVLAGGRGLRLGAAVPKALVPVAGVTLLERAVATLGEACDEVVVVTPRGLGLPLPRSARAVHDAGEGPLVALAEGLAAAPYDRAVALGVDFPLVRGRLVAAIARALAGAVAVVPRPGGALQPLVAAYSPDARGRLVRAVAEGQRSLVAAVAALEPRVIEGAALDALPGGSEAFLNVNTPGDLARAEAALRALQERA